MAGFVFFTLLPLSHICIKIVDMVILQQPDAFCFSSALKDIIIQSEANLSVTFVTNGDVFLEETYMPDNENKIYIRELGKLFLPYISKITLQETFTIFAGTTNSESDVEITTTVQYGLSEINIAATDYLESHFLTLLQGEKITCPGQKEYLSLVVSEATQVTMTACYQSNDRITQTIQVTDINQVITLDVSPATFDDPENISYIVVVAGNRNFVYWLRRPSAAGPAQFVFLNSFGVKETFIPAGLISVENKYENQFGTFNGMYRKYNIDLVKEHTANTGVLTENMSEWLEDIFLSKDVFLFSPAGIEKEVTISEATVKRSSARDELPAYEFKYRLSKANHSEHYIQEHARIFDDSFDYTFN
jgi:hypothetical protein